MITLYGFGRVHPAVIGETRDLRVAWALEETGLDYRVHGLDHTGGELDGEAYGRISCFRQVPVIDDDGLVLAESGAILLYLAEKAGKLIPADVAGRHRVSQWCFAAVTTVERPLLELLLLEFSAPTPAYDKRRDELRAEAHRHFKNLERWLAGRAWIACDEFTVADLLLATVLREARKTDLMTPYPRLAAYYRRALDRPAWQRALVRHAERLGAAVDDLR
ncbi:MAG: glutathione S-transferase family protein [Myxococcales bacterium]|nr:glutathione S-transferase family protein [Myxococcales bacterium]